ncbi:hypothetical protein DUNSADRAFT_12810 [Dunaliella salina]|uniref:FAD-binding domain-containing protein n=1 Tax=Dunaliella salina TaxID=3046 RepID=A0ABQ7GAI9_DUNSA|nr:hypothetical protein DUNSADRAFT_12810 [Dunaliella salina]|eukprot:KAF5831619.1 hypothetical protein DUNSADRAFT_12810 [Dunaliella salina]
MLGRSPQFAVQQHSWHQLPTSCLQPKPLRHSPSGQRSDLSCRSVVELSGDTSDTQEASTSSRGRILIVGAGPAGCLCAALMSQRGYTVDVFEQRQQPKPADTRSHRSYPMVLSSRSAQGFKEAGLQLPLPEPQAAIFMPNGKLEMLWEDSDYCKQYIVDRVAFGKHMFEATRQQYGSRITWHWGHALQRVDLDQRVATFTSSSDPAAALSQGSTSSSADAPATSTTTAVSYELLIGADGAGSKLRQLMQNTVPGMSVDLLFHNRSTYKTYHGLSCEQGSLELVPGFLSHEHSRYLYTFNAKNMPTLVIWRQADGKASGMLTRAPSYDAQELRTKISSAYPQIPQEWAESIVAQTCDTSGQPPSPFGRLMSTTRLDGPRCVLLGDAGHPMTSTLAQGCNLALESVRVFARSLDSVSGDLDQAPAAFTSARLEDVHAMQTMEYMQILSSNAPGATASALERMSAKATMLGSALLTLGLHKLMPSSFPAPVYLLDGLRDARVPYKRVLETMRMHAAALIALAAALLTGAANQAVYLAAEMS